MFKKDHQNKVLPYFVYIMHNTIFNEKMMVRSKLCVSEFGEQAPICMYILYSETVQPGGKSVSTMH